MQEASYQFDPLTITEVGPRDGLQSLDVFVSTETKVAYIEQLVTAGLKRIEVTAFVSPEAIPQMVDAEALMTVLPRHDDVTYSALVPNLTGLQRAIAADVDEIAVFASASEAFSWHNIRRDIATSMQQYAEVVAQARQHDLPVRGYVSCCWGCPYVEAVQADKIAEMVDQFAYMGCERVVLSDTTGQATPETVTQLLHMLLNKGYPADLFAMHFHDTQGNAMDNAVGALALGVRHFDSATGGIGGCPNAPGSMANLATETLLNYLNTLSPVNIDFACLRQAGKIIHQAIGTAD